MKKVLVCALLTVFAFNVFAQEDGEAPAAGGVKYANAIFVHPLSLIVGAAADIMPLMLNFTIEHSLAPKAALIVTPNFLMWNLESGGDELSITGFGAGVGYRKYLSKPSSGVYLQAKLDAGYMMASMDYVNFSMQQKTADFSGVDIGILGYVGAKGQWDHVCMFIDLGLGYEYVGYKADVEDADVSFDYGSSGLGFDLNFGLGYAF